MFMSVQVRPHAVEIVPVTSIHSTSLKSVVAFGETLIFIHLEPVLQLRVLIFRVLIFTSVSGGPMRIALQNSQIQNPYRAVSNPWGS